MSLHQYSLAQLASGLRDKAFSSVELTTHYLERIKRLGDALNCYITVTEAQALAQARAADAALADGSAGALTGIPVAHKDLFCTDGVRTSCGSKILDAFVAPYDATVVAKLKTAGMPMLGKTNMDEFAMGSSNETSYYGPVSNPWDSRRVPGGSSGGSAAAVAARLAPVATGTDTGGSIRQPAALCGITGVKPTYGRVSRYGMVAFASSLDQGGVFGASAEDCALALQAMAGFDARDSTAIETPPPDYVAGLTGAIKGLKIGLPKQYFGVGVEAGVAQRVEQAIEQYRALGADIVEVSLPHAHLAVPAYYVVAPAECSSNLSRMDGVRFGYRAADPRDLDDLYKRSRGDGFGDEVKRRIMIGSYALSAGYYDAYYLQAQQVRRLIADDFQQAFTEVDMLMSPTAPTTAFKIGDKLDDPVTMYLCDINTIAVNLAGLPGVSIPCGFSDGLPVGLQLIGAHLDEGRLLNAAHAYQQATDWHTRRPDGV